MKAFNGDTILYRHVLALKERYGLTSFVETGTYHGDTTASMADVFEKVFTCEINPDYQYIAKKRCAGRDNIVFASGSSPESLRLIGPETANKALFFLDAHWNAYNPLLDELKVIAEMGVKPVIIIHDFYVPGKSTNDQQGPFGWDATNQGQRYDLEWILPSLKKIYDGYPFDYSYPTEVEGAMRGYITITPA